jgi:hypothetical protein
MTDLHPSYLSPKFDCPAPTLGEEKPLKEGVGFGITALLCGLFCALVPVLILGFVVLILPILPCCSPLATIPFVLFLISIPCAIAGIVFGLLGRKTDGRIFAWIGLAPSLLYGVLVLSFLIIALILFLFP